MNVPLCVRAMWNASVRGNSSSSTVPWPPTRMNIGRSGSVPCSNMLYHCVIFGINHITLVMNMYYVNGWMILPDDRCDGLSHRSDPMAVWTQSNYQAFDCYCNIHVSEASRNCCRRMLPALKSHKQIAQTLYTFLFCWILSFAANCLQLSLFVNESIMPIEQSLPTYSSH